MVRDVMYGGYKLFFKAADTVVNRVILKVLLMLFLGLSNNDVIIKITI
jgi:hypothetical protein